jgi:tripartite-type tricarboxylate transporter receptor subunit TctC
MRNWLAAVVASGCSALAAAAAQAQTYPAKPVSIIEPGARR